MFIEICLDPFKDMDVSTTDLQFLTINSNYIVDIQEDKENKARITMNDGKVFKTDNRYDELLEALGTNREIVETFIKTIID